MIALLIPVLLAPVPFASVLPWSWTLVASYVGALLGWHGVQILRGRKIVPIRMRRLVWIVTPFTLVVFWAAIQSLPITPEAWANPIWENTQTTLGIPVKGTISVSPFDTLAAITTLLTNGATFWLAVQYGRSKRNADLGLKAIAIAGGLYATYGLAEFASGTETILWFSKTAYLGDLTSTFVNRNTYAGYVGLGLLCTTAILARQIADAVASQGWREKLRRLLSSLGGRSAFWLVLWAILFSALLLTHSRGGFICTLLGLAAMSIAVSVKSRVHAKMLVLFLMPLLILGIAFFAAGGEIVSKRITETDVTREERPEVYQITAAAISAFPVRGTGYGTFSDVFQHYRTIDLILPYHMAHNTYLEDALELGIPGCALLCLSVMAVFWRCVVGIRVRTRDISFPVLGIGAITLASAASAVDFTFQIPAPAITLAMIMGLAVAQSWSQRRSI